MLWRPFRAGAKAGLRIDADRGLQCGRAIDCKEHCFAERLLRVAPLIERTDDLFRYAFLERQEGIVLGDRLALLARLVGRVLHRRHEGVLAAQRLVLQAKRMPVPHQLRHLRRHHRLDPGLNDTSGKPRDSFPRPAWRSRSGARLPANCRPWRGCRRACAPRTASPTALTVRSSLRVSGPLASKVAS